MTSYIPDFLTIVVPSLVATIRAVRPELLTEESYQSEPIEENMPARYLEREVIRIEDIGEPLNASFFTKADTNPVDWYVPS